VRAAVVLVLLRLVAVALEARLEVLLRWVEV
jgi:hypothetical protein